MYRDGKELSPRCIIINSRTEPQVFITPGPIGVHHTWSSGLLTLPAGCAQSTQPTTRIQHLTCRAGKCAPQRAQFDAWLVLEILSLTYHENLHSLTELWRNKKKIKHKNTITQLNKLNCMYQYVSQYHKNVLLDSDDDLYTVVQKLLTFSLICMILALTENKIIIK